MTRARYYRYWGRYWRRGEAEPQETEGGLDAYTSEDAAFQALLMLRGWSDPARIGYPVVTRVAPIGRRS